MCGILAVLNFNQRPVDKALLRKMTDTMTHRGPDDAGYWTNPGGNVGLGHRRLAIIDLSPAGHEPMCNEDQTIWLTFNGEIYNFQELRPRLEAKGHQFYSQTDAEVIIHAYEEWGVDCLQYFNGMWAFALWDENRRRLFVSRDRFGIKPLVYYYDRERFICGSEIKALVADGTIPRQIDPTALHHYLTLMDVPVPYTIYKDIFKLKPGHYLVVEQGEIHQKSYWHLKIGAPVQASQPQIVEELEAKLKESIRLRMISDAPLGTFLSGGLDSSLVSAFAADALKGKQALNTFAVTFRGMDTYDESPWSRRVANDLGTNHQEFNMSIDFVEILPDLIKIFDEPFAVSSVAALYLLSQETAKHVKVVLTGDGGDEVFAGYAGRQNLIDVVWDWLSYWPMRSYQAATAENSRDSIFSFVRWADTSPAEKVKWAVNTSTLSNAVARRRHYLNSLYIFREVEKQTLYTPAWSEMVNGVFTSDLFWQQLPNTTSDRMARWLHMDLKTTLVDQMLTKVDKATMAHSLEARVPLLDHNLVEYALRLPASTKARYRRGKLILKKLGENYFDSEVLYRPKHGFNVPLKLWFKDKLFDFVSDILSEPAIRQGGYFQPEVVHQILKRHRADPNIDLSHHIFILLSFELWRRQQH